jgi:mitochondrial distribution and morphology protein 12
MSIDLDWHALDAELTASVVSFLTSAFTTAQRPSFLGEIAVTSFSFGDSQPELEVLDIRDIYKEFLEVDDEEQLLLPQEMPPLHGRGAGGMDGGELDDWHSNPPNYYYQHSSQDHPDSASQYGGPAQPFRRPPRPMPHLQPSSALFSPGLNNRSYLSPSHTPPLDSAHPSNDYGAPSFSSDPSSAPPASSSSSPSLQLHLQVTYSGNLTLGLSTCLLINYPSPRFMSLPLKLSVTSLAFSGTMLVAFEGDRKRVHISLADPASKIGGLGGATAGARLLSGAVVESEVGQADKHVLKNVGKVEKFVLDVVRSTLESELVFPCVVFCFSAIRPALTFRPSQQFPNDPLLGSAFHPDRLFTSIPSRHRPSTPVDDRQRAAAARRCLEG